MPTFTHLISSTPGNPVSYNPSMAETFSWIPVSNAGRPLYARAMYITNVSEIAGGGGGGTVTVNTVNLENKVDNTNNKLNTQIGILSSVDNRLIALTALSGMATAVKQDTQIGILSSVDNKLIALTALSGMATAVKQDTQINLLNSLTASNIKVPGFSIPPYDSIELFYYTATNNLSSVIYGNAGSSVLTLSFTYNPNPPTSDNALLVRVQKV